MERMKRIGAALRRPEIWLPGLGALAVAAGFARWWMRSAPTLWPSRIAAFASALLFMALVVALGSRAVAFLRQPAAAAPAAAPDDRPRFARTRAALLFAAALVFYLGVVAAARLLTGNCSRLVEAYDIYINLDSNQYLAIAKEGYVHAADTGEILEVVFFPGYPVLAGILMMAIPDALLCMFLAAWAPFIAAGPVLYELLRLDYDHKKTMRVLALVCLMPAAAFFAMPMSESLFLLCAAATLLNARKGRWLAAGVCGLLACFTRSVGILLMLPMGMEGFRQLLDDPDRRLHRRAWTGRALCAFIAPLGLVLYLYVNFIITGHPLTFLTYQRAHWSQHLTWFFATASMQADYAMRWLAEHNRGVWGLWIANLFVGYGSLALMLLRGRRLRPSYALWFPAYFAVCYGTSWLLSGPRYMIAFFPLAIAADELPLPKWIVYPACAALTALYACALALRWGVW